MAMSTTADLAPMSEMNTTPLIDVMLVLLIMFIVTIPLQTHAVKLDLPDGRPLVVVDPVRNEIVVTAQGRIFWNGADVGSKGLALQLARVGAMTEQPEVQLRPDPLARYEAVDEVLAMTKRAEVTRLGFVGNEQYQRF